MGHTTDHLWMHFTRMGSYAGHPVPIIERGEGCYIWDTNGKRYLDALSGLFVVQVGHGREELAQAAAAGRPASSRSSRSGPTPTRPAIELADRIAGAAPGDLNKVFFSSGGGESVETAWKLAKQYFKLTGKPTKYKVISRAIAYHGTTQGALSITGVPPFKEAFEPLVPGSVRVPNTNFYRAPWFVADDEKAFGRWAADQIEEAILMEGPDTVAAVFVEPVQNAGGCFPPPPGYFERLREICDTHNVLLVSDEVICAYGRLGTMFGAQKFGYQPDIITSRQGPDLGLLPARRRASSPTGSSSRSARAPPPSRTATPSAGTRSPARSRWPTSTSSSPRTSSTCCATRTPSARRWSGSRTCRSSATSAATATSSASNWSRTRPPRRPSATRRASGSCADFVSTALFDRGLYCRADDRGDTVVQVAPPLISGQTEFDEIESILRSVFTDAWARL